jgi:hypothetical protein
MDQRSEIAVTHGTRLRRRIGRLIALTVLAGVVVGWTSIYFIPLALRLGLSERAAHRIPFVGFAVGLSVALGMQRSSSLRQAVGCVTAPLIFGAIGWAFGLLVGVLLMVFGASEDFVDPVPTIGFGFGFALGIVPLAVWGYEGFAKVGERLASFFSRVGSRH